MMNEDTVQIVNRAPGPESPQASEMSAPGTPPVSTPSTLLGIFLKPRVTFQALAGRPRVLAPILVLVIFQLVFSLVAVQSGVVKNDTLARLEAKNAPAEEIATMSRALDSPWRYVFAVAGPIVRVFFLLVFAALYYFMANLMLGAQLRFIHYLCIAAYGGIVAISDEIAQLAIALARGTLEVHLGMGAFFGDDLSAPLRILDAITDPFLLWATAIQAVGVAVMARKSFAFGALAVLPGYVILAALSALRH